MSLRRSPIRGSLLLAALVPLGAAPAFAQDAAELANFAFASRLGSGIYDVNGQTIQIYRIPVSFDLLRSTPERDWGLRLRIPLTLGFYDFDIRDLPQRGFPDEFSTVGVAPGLWFEVPATTVWTLWPFAEGGPIRDFTTDSTSWVYTAGVRSEIVLPERLEWVVRNEAAWTGASGEGAALDDSFGELRTGAEVWGRVGAVRGSRLLVGGFAVNYLYWSRAEFVEPALQGTDQDPDRTYRAQWEAGVLLRARPAPYLWKIKLPDVGVSYRFGDSPSSVRVIFGRSF